MMRHIFEDKKEPLFSRASHIIHLQAFGTNTLKEILHDYNPNYTSEDLLALYTFTGGVAWYVELLMTAKAWSWKKMIDTIFREQSLFINEGKNLLIEEVGKEYGIYFSILECIARGINTRGEIENAIGVKEIGGYLSKLDKDFGIITQHRPIYSKPASKSVKYAIADNFLTIWFRFFYKYNSYIESGNFAQLKDIVIRDYPTISGIMLERYFRQRAKEEGKYTLIGNFWDRKGEHEIDIILVNEHDKQLRIGEIKRQAKNIEQHVLRKKADYFLSLYSQLASYEQELLALSMEDM
jgi:AAA+ ATPase superfamily predicted ATPase